MKIESTTFETIWTIEFTADKSLDFPCDFCGRGAYQNNFRIKRGNQLELVVCPNCLNKLKQEEKND